MTIKIILLAAALCAPVVAEAQTSRSASDTTAVARLALHAVGARVSGQFDLALPPGVDSAGRPDRYGSAIFSDISAVTLSEIGGQVSARQVNGRQARECAPDSGAPGGPRRCRVTGNRPIIGIGAPKFSGDSATVIVTVWNNAGTGADVHMVARSFGVVARRVGPMWKFVRVDDEIFTG